MIQGLTKPDSPFYTTLVGPAFHIMRAAFSRKAALKRGQKVFPDLEMEALSTA